MNLWQFIESPPAGIFSQMALDRELFEEFLEDPFAVPRLRIYQVSGPAYTIGRLHQKNAPTSIREGGIFCFLGKKRPVCVRPTGGGLVRHGRDLIYSVMARADTFPTFNQVRTCYLSFHEAVQDTFRQLGIETRLLRCDEAKSQKEGRRFPVRGFSRCFSEPVATDVLIGGKKVAGGGQWRRKGGFLHQGSVQIPAGVSFNALESALVRAFKQKFEIVWAANEEPFAVRAS